MRKHLYPRLFGLLCLAIAAGAGWWGIWEPLQQAIAQEPHVRYSTKTFVLVPAAAVFGLFFTLFGGSISYRDAQRRRFTTAGWLLMALVLLGAGAGFWWFKARFVELGYAYSGADPRPSATATPFVMPPVPQVPAQPDFRPPH